MPQQLTSDDFKESLNGHVATKGDETRAKYGPHIGWKELQQILRDRSAVRYPCEVVFDSQPLLKDEFAHAMAKGERPEDGYTIYVHPFFMTQLQQVPLLVLYQLVRVNYGEFASPDDAETFGASVLGLSKDDYYNTLCELADQLDPCDLGD